MNNQKVDPQKVTKPIQLLAAWLVGLIMVNGGFLGTAVALGSSAWESSVLIIAAVLNVPLFLGAIFLLQTRFRPELQEDSFYSRYLDKKSNQIVTVKNDDHHELNTLKAEFKKLEGLIQHSHSEEQNSFGNWSIALNKLLPDYFEIRKSLRSEGIRLKSIFGDTLDSELPKNKVVALSHALDHQSVITLLKLMSQFDIDGYAYFDPIPEIDPEDVYIGSYGYDQGEDLRDAIPITDELRQLLADSCSKADLNEYELLTQKLDK
ncbi:hypothetical protein AB4511_04485 [Vibrio sp. 10N.222.54.F6]|uniref:hypothetical protein n=1 Tax=unclassified Vibrio TaxID=2614977 RepID=UPI000C8440A1|nr:hypothetical protein [Vibrio sp. 10N.261.51.A7]PML71304.1 hypothetical protein BCT71_11100 [Vibrio sp. 10N.261.51.A7]